MRTPPRGDRIARRLEGPAAPPPTRRGLASVRRATSCAARPIGAILSAASRCDGSDAAAASLNAGSAAAAALAASPASPFPGSTSAAATATGMIPARRFSVNVLTATSSSRAAAVLLIPRDSISDACWAISNVNTTRGTRPTRNPERRLAPLPVPLHRPADRHPRYAVRLHQIPLRYAADQLKLRDPKTDLAAVVRLVAIDRDQIAEIRGDPIMGRHRMKPADRESRRPRAGGEGNRAWKRPNPHQSKLAEPRSQINAKCSQ